MTVLLVAVWVVGGLLLALILGAAIRLAEVRRHRSPVVPDIAAWAEPGTPGVSGAAGTTEPERTPPATGTR